ncbi:hypothetical protein GCM10007962_24140 [Yeosuana aromativorans]|uniref:Uncharacterized protein n=1 Tax=Yeosuana aromativorans TaxID=288019 RepID=A0A8J3BRV4_9FLAO|nr:hypothetical protein [Yeosuana aromativorans]GGK29062.1 hypothetical protein GCM10007962_24140 [Yeosuana aromativorans]
MKGCVLNSIEFLENGHKISFDYEISTSFSKYFNIENKFYAKYDKDVSSTPLSIAVVPFLANVMPIAWFAGFDVCVDELDKTFFNALKILKQQFEKHHPKIKNKGKLIYKKLVDNKFEGNHSMLLFSGGLDSFESLTRNYDKDPYLVSIHGADVQISDQKRWHQFKEFNEKEPIIDKSKLTYIESNLRDFYTYKVDLLIKNIGWWGEIQHGMALLGVLAPLSALLQATQIFIASSNTSEVDFSWGSRPEVDENMKWANIHVKHDGYQFRRPEKVANVVDFAKQHHQNINLRVCYSELRNGANCNRCAKCQRTMFGIILANDNPEKYGFKIPNDFYELVLSNFNKKTQMSTGLKYEWWCLQEKAKENKPFFVIANLDKERAFIQKFIDLDLQKTIKTNTDNIDRIHRLKFILQHKFSGLYNFYKQIRYK